jgi:hypothetical protein
MVWTTHDLSDITASLVGMLSDAVKAWPLWVSNHGPIPNFLINVTGNSPDNMRHAQDGECQLNLYLLHVGQDPFFRNTPVFGPGAMANTQQPLSLNLSYLLTAFAPDNADREQRVMSIALSCFHEQPVYTSAAGEFLTISLGIDTLPEMSGLWQSFTVAYRLSTIYRVAVAFLTPSQPPTALNKPPVTLGIALGPSNDLTVQPQLFAQVQLVKLTAPANDTDPDDVMATPAAVVFVGGAQVVIGGQGLDTAAAAEIFLTPVSGGAPVQITGWRTGPVLGSELVLDVPAAYAIGGAPAPPLSTPVPGVYLLSVGNGTAVSNAIPVTIVPLFQPVATPAVLHATAGVYSFSGAGFVPGATLLFVGGVQLDGAAYAVSPGGTAVTFRLPATQPHGLFALRVRVDGVDAPPTWQVQA